MLEKKVIIDQVIVTETRAVQVRQSVIVTEDGQELSRQFHRWALIPGDDLTGQDPLVVRICQAAWVGVERPDQNLDLIM